MSQTTRRERLIKEHNAKMKIISATAQANGLSEATLFYAAQFGIYGIPWITESVNSSPMEVKER